MVTASEKMDLHLSTIGKRVRWPATDELARGQGSHAEIACVGTGRWEVRAQWLVNERYDSDPDSIRCGCHLQGYNHAHAEAGLTGLADAWELYSAVKQMLQLGQAATVLGVVRVI